MRKFNLLAKSLPLLALVLLTLGAQVMPASSCNAAVNDTQNTQSTNEANDTNAISPRLLVVGFPKFIYNSPFIDPQYQKELQDAGFEVHAASLGDTLSANYIRQFNVIILASIPPQGFSYRVSGRNVAAYPHNIALIRRYIAQGGGVVLMPAFYSQGSAFLQAYQDLLAPYGGGYLLEQLREATTPIRNPKDGNYEKGQIITPPDSNPLAALTTPITKGLSTFLYPTNVLRFDDGYATTPILVDDQWQVLAQGSPTSGTAKAIKNGTVGPQQTKERNVYAIRQVGKGYLAISGIHCYYTLTQPYSEKAKLGENHPGIIAGKVLQGEANGRRSDYGKLLLNTYKTMASHAASQGLGGPAVALPEQPSLPPIITKVDWHTQTAPLTWQARVWPQKTAEGQMVYDSLPDPAAAGKLHHYKLLVGPKTATGGGSGSVAEYRQAAIKAGYSAVLFAQNVTDMTPQAWAAFVKECAKATDEQFISLPGYQIHDAYGGQYLLLGATQYPDPTWLTPDQKRIVQVNRLRFANVGVMCVYHRPAGSALNLKMAKFYHGISVATYDDQGQLVDQGFPAWQWSAASDSNPIPIAVHELHSPDQVALASESGYQQIMPAADLAQGIDYFRAATDLYFETPARHYLSEGPIITGWSVFNKDIGPIEWNRQQYRLSLGVASDQPIKEVTLTDRFDIAGRWLPNATSFATTIDGPHDEQHLYYLQAVDAQGRRVLSPAIRTVTNNYRVRCGDRQNWLGSIIATYTGTPFRNFPNYHLPIRNSTEGINAISRTVASGNIAPILDFPFFSNQYQVNDIAFNTRYINATFQAVSFDSKPTHAVRPTDLVEGRVRMFTPWPIKQNDFTVAVVNVDIKLKGTVEPDGNPTLWPELATAYPGNNLLILPGQKPSQLATIVTNSKDRKGVPGDQTNLQVDLPVGSYAGGYIPLTPGLRVHDRAIGFAPPSPDTFAVPEGTTWHAQFLMLKGGRFHWRGHQNDWAVDPYAQRAMNEMGFSGTPPYQFNLTTGSLTKLAYFADLQAIDGGVSGTLNNPTSHALLYNIPLRIDGLNPRIDAALWRSDSDKLIWFAQWQGKGYVPLDADKTVTFYAGNIVQTHPALFVRPVIWNSHEAWFRVNNPTDHPITTTFRTPRQIKGFLPVDQQITIPAGSSLQVHQTSKADPSKEDKP